MKLAFNTAYALAYKLDIIRKGKIIPATDWRQYMITDAGLDAVGALSTSTGSMLQFLSAAVLGTGTAVPVRRDSNPITFTQSGTTLTASSSFFSASDVGRLFKWGTGSSGNEIYITAFTSTTQVTVGTSATVTTPSIGTIWYVNSSALVTPIAGLTYTNEANSGTNSSSVAGSVCTITQTKVIVSSALASPATVTEIGFNTSYTNSALFDRDVVSPSVGLLAGDQARVTVQMIRNLSPVTSQAAANVGTGCDTTGTFYIEGLDFGNNGSEISYFVTTGDPGNGQAGGGAKMLEPCKSGNLGLITANFTPGTFTVSGNGVNKTHFCVAGTVLSYGSGTYRRGVRGTWSISQANGTIYGIGINSTGSVGTSTTSRLNLFWKFNTPFTKSSSQTVTATIDRYWSRVLIN